MKNLQNTMAVATDSPKDSPRFVQRNVKKAPARWPHRRRSMAQAVEGETAVATREATSALEAYWNEHAVKTGIVLFWVWYAAANWQALGRLAGSAWRTVVGG
ncbi:MAG: hypothetical protein E6R07_06075 [Nevskiaceae bacterium]|nr:MAG: hypothetical protein E6R07_06075 [Nevskiaceae bacterium]